MFILSQDAFISISPHTADGISRVKYITLFSCKQKLDFLLIQVGASVCCLMHPVRVETWLTADSCLQQSPKNKYFKKTLHHILQIIDLLMCYSIIYNFIQYVFRAWAFLTSVSGILWKPIVAGEVTSGLSVTGAGADTTDNPKDIFRTWSDQ